MRAGWLSMTVVVSSLLGCSGAPPPHIAPVATTARVDVTALAAEVSASEVAFARTMADRDLGAFSVYLAKDAIFFGGETATRGQGAVTDAWRKFFTAKEAPFSWKPEQVQVLDSGDLALSTGPVLDAKGNRIATFNSIWRRESPGVWRVVFDRGCDVCAEKAP